MQSFGKRVDIVGGLRKAARERVSLAAKAITPVDEKIVLISDLGRRGAKLTGHGMPPPESQVILVVGEFETTCRVVWSTDENCGVEFSTELTADELVEFKRQGRTGRIYSVV